MLWAWSGRRKLSSREGLRWTRSANVKGAGLSADLDVDADVYAEESLEVVTWDMVSAAR